MTNYFLQKFKEQKLFIINSLIFIILCLIIISDFDIFISIVFGFILAKFGFNISNFLHKKLKIPYIISSILITLICGFFISIAIYFLANILFLQLKKLILILMDENFIKIKIDEFNKNFESLSQKIKALSIVNHIPNEIKSSIVEYIDSIPTLLSGKIKEYSIFFIKQSYLSGLKILSIFYSILLTLIFAFFMMYDFKKITNFKDKIFGIYSVNFKEKFVEFKNLISKMLIGQIKVALILFIFYAISFGVFKFEYYILYSLIFAILTLIPIIGSIFSIIFMLTSLYFFGYSIDYAIKLFIVFLFGYFLENLYLTPKLVGSSLNVHPAIILVGIILFSKFFGIIGMFFALPIIAFITNLIKNHLNEIENEKKLHYN